MPRLFTRHSLAGASGGERVFMDDEGRRRSAALTQRDAPRGALVRHPRSAWRRSTPPDGTIP
jgi:hypothetical protein